MQTTGQEIAMLEVVLRSAAVSMLALASGFIWLQLLRRRIRPAPLWAYVGLIATITLIWRITILAFVFMPELRANLQSWITPVTAALYALSGVSLLLLAYAASRRRRDDG